MEPMSSSYRPGRLDKRLQIARRNREDGCPGGITPKTGSNKTSKGGGEREPLCDINLLRDTETRWKDERGNKPKDNQSLHSHNTFQDGKLEDSEESDKTARLSDKDRSARRFLASCHPSETQEVLPIPLAETDTRMAGNAVRVQGRTSSLHFNDESDHESVERIRNKISHLYGRFAYHGGVSNSGLESQRHRDSGVDSVRHDNKLGEERSHTVTTREFLGRDSRLNKNVSGTATREIGERKIEGEGSPHTRSKGKAPSPDRLAVHRGDTSVDGRLHPSNTPTPEQPDLGPETGREGPSTAVPGLDRRPGVVAGINASLERKIDSNSDAIARPRHGCIGDSMGCDLHRLYDLRADGIERLICRCDDVKSPRAHCHHVWGADICQKCKLARLCSSCKNGQPSSHELHQSDGRSRTSPLRSGRTVTQVRTEQENTGESGVDTGHREHGGGPPLPRGDGLERCDAPSRPVQDDRHDVGAAHPRRSGGHVESSTPEVRQLDSGSRVFIHRPDVPPLPSTRQYLLERAVCNDSTSLTESKSGEGDSDFGYTIMEPTIMVANLMGAFSGLALSAAKSQYAITEILDGKTTRVCPPVEFSRRQAVSYAFEKFGLSKDAVEVYWARYKADKHGIKLHSYDSHFRAWQAWCLQTGRHCFVIDERDVAEYATYLLKQKKSLAGTVRGHLSALGHVRMVLHCLNDPSPLSESKLLRHFRASADRLAPPKDRYKEYYHFGSSWWAKLANYGPHPDSCDLLTLRNRLIILLMVDGAARSCDIACLDSEIVWGRCTVTGRRTALLTYFYKKEMRFPKKQTILHHEYPKDPRICTYTHLVCWMQKSTEKFLVPPNPAGDSPIKGREKRVFTFNTGRDIKVLEIIPLICYLEEKTGMVKPLLPQTIANIALGFMKLADIDVSKYKAHSIRGAAASKLWNMGLQQADVMARSGWQSATTLHKHYLIKQSYLETNAGVNQHAIPADILRTPVRIQRHTYLP